MATDPTARNAYRVPRSEVDNLFVRGEPMPETRASVGVVVSVDSADTCTVMVDDELVVGVPWLGSVAPTVDDIIEVEQRGDLMVVPAANDINTFVEGMSDTAEHIVSDEDPGVPAPIQINVGGSMRSVDAWAFTAAEATKWARELNESGQGMRCYQVTAPAGNDAVLWSEQSFEIKPSDQIDVQATFYSQVPSITAAVVLLYGSVEGANPSPGEATTVETVGAAVSVTGSPEAQTMLSRTVYVGGAVAFPAGTAQPRTAKVGLKLTGDGDSALVVTSATVTVASRAWPLGSLWMDPDAEDPAPITVATSAQGTAGPAQPWPGSTAWTRVVGAKKVVITAPPSSGGIAMVYGMASVGQVPTNSVGFDLGFESNIAGGQFPWVRAYMNAANTSLPTFVSGMLPLAPGQVAEIYLVYRYSATPGTTPHILRYPTVQCVFLPGAVVGGSGGLDPMIRYYDGDSWRPEKMLPAALDLSVEGTVVLPTKTATTTTLTRSASTLHEGESLTLVAQVSPSATGSVTFYRSASAVGPWTALGTSSLSGSPTTATRTWVTQAKGGPWYFRAVYLGSETHATSTSATSSATNVLVAKTGQAVIPCTWAQAYKLQMGDYVQIADTRVWHGDHANSYGPTGSLLRFNNTVLPAGADPTAATLVCKTGGWAYTWNADGVDLWLGTFKNQNTVPTVWLVETLYAETTFHVAVGGWSVRLASDTGGSNDAALLASIKDPSFSGITVGPPGGNTSKQFSGYSTAPGKDQFTLIVDYTYWTVP